MEGLINIHYDFSSKKEINSTAQIQYCTNYLVLDEFMGQQGPALSHLLRRHCITTFTYVVSLYSPASVLHVAVTV